MELEKKVVELDVNDVLPNRFQPRIKFKEDSINELSESIKEHGVIQPIVVRPMGDKYEIIAGERRYKASLLAGKRTVPTIVIDLNDKDSAEVALIENVQREDLTPIEEAISYKKMLDMGYLTQEELAKKLGKNQSTVANKLRLLNLSEDVQEAVLEGKMSERHARSLLKLSNEKQQIDMLNKIIENRMTVRKTDEEILKIIKPEPIVIKEENEFNPFENKIKEEGKVGENMNNFDPFNLTAPAANILPEALEMPGFNATLTPVAPENKTEEIPGFMNISSIEQNASDINVVKPQVDMGILLNSPVDNSSQLEEKQELSSGKFFSFEFNDTEEKNNFDPFASAADTTSVGVANVDNVLPTEPVIPTSPVAEPMPNSFTFNELSTNSSEAPVSTPNLMETMDFTIPSKPVIPMVSIVEEMPNPASNLMSQTPLVETASPIASTEFGVPVLEEQTPIVPLGFSTPNPVSDETLNSNAQNMIEETPTPEPVVYQSPFDLPQATPVNDNLAVVGLHQEGPKIMPSLVENQNDEMVIQENLTQTEAESSNNIGKALEVVRNCAKDLENLGFKLELDEIDLGSLYQVMFKIHKQ